MTEPLPEEPLVPKMAPDELIKNACHVLLQAMSLAGVPLEDEFAISLSRTKLSNPKATKPTKAYPNGKPATRAYYSLHLHHAPYALRTAVFDALLGMQLNVQLTGSKFANQKGGFFLIGEESLSILAGMKPEIKEGKQEITFPEPLPDYNADMQLLAQRLRVAATDRHLPLRGIVAAPGEEQEAGAPSSINRHFTKLLMEMGMPSGSFGCIGTGQTGDILRRDKGGLTVMLYRVTPNSVPDPEACAWALAHALCHFGFKVSFDTPPHLGGAFANQFHVGGNIENKLLRLLGTEDGSLDFKRPIISQMKDELRHFLDANILPTTQVDGKETVAWEGVMQPTSGKAQGT